MADVVSKTIDIQLDKPLAFRNPNIVIMCFDAEGVKQKASEFGFSWILASEIRDIPIQTPASSCINPSMDPDSLLSSATREENTGRVEPQSYQNTGLRWRRVKIGKNSKKSQSSIYILYRVHKAFPPSFIRHCPHCHYSQTLRQKPYRTQNR